MGGLLSKETRTSVTRQTSAALRNEIQPTRRPWEAKNRLAESARTEAIEKDGADPDFLSNLSRLGEVRVDHHMQPIRPAADNTRLFDTRVGQTSSQEGEKSLLYAFMLSDLLDKRKSVQTREDLAKLAAESGIAPERLERLARFVNSPSIDGSSIRPCDDSVLSVTELVSERQSRHTVEEELNRRL